MATIEIQFSPDYDVILQNSDVIGTLVRRMQDGTNAVEASIQGEGVNTLDRNQIAKLVNETVEVCTLVLCTLRNLHHATEKLHGVKGRRNLGKPHA